MKLSHFFGMIALLAVLVLVAASPPLPAWQPPHVDATLTGEGTDEEPLGVAIPVTYTNYTAVLTQASTSAPTQVVLENTIDTSANIAWTYTGAGVYTGELDDAFTTDKTYVEFTVGNATGLVPHAYSITDSTVVVKTFGADGNAANLAGTGYLTIRVYPE